MKVILTKKYENLGAEGDIINVRPGYARNYLIPQLIALNYNPGNMKRYEEMQKLKEVRENKSKKKSQVLAETLNKISCTALVAVGEEDKLFGAVTSQTIAELLKGKGFDIDRRKILLDEPIKALGIYTVPIKLHSDVEAKIKVWVVKE